MNYLGLIITIVFLSLGNVIAQVETSNENNSEILSSDLKVYDFDGLQDYLKSKDSNKTYVVNFWATWCAPCVKELPYFEQLNANYANSDVEVILVSLDFPKYIESKLKPFLTKNDLKSEVVLLNDVDANTWIPKVDKDWSGSIPATIIYNENKRQFYERSFNYQELETEVKQFLE